MVEMVEIEIFEALELIVAVDQTPEYEHDRPRPWDGEYPPGGQQWPTPREVAKAVLRQLRS